MNSHRISGMDANTEKHNDLRSYIRLHVFEYFIRNSAMFSYIAAYIFLSTILRIFLSLYNVRKVWKSAE